MRFFFYGTLMDAEIRVLVLGRHDGAKPVEPATLPGFRRLTMRGRTYPVIVADRSSSVEGCLVRGLDRAAATRLDAFEGDEYDRIRCAVVLADGRSVEGWTFVAGRRASPSTAEWEFETWRRRHKRDLRRAMH